MPSSSDDFTFASITSEGNGRKTVMRKTTGSHGSAPNNICAKTALRTLVPQKTIAIPYLALADLGEVKDADA